MTTINTYDYRAVLARELTARRSLAVGMAEAYLAYRAQEMAHSEAKVRALIDTEDLRREHDDALVERLTIQFSLGLAGELPEYEPW